MKKLFTFLAIFSLFLGLNATAVRLGSPQVLAEAPEPSAGPPEGLEMGPGPGEIPEGGTGEISGPPAEVGPAISKPAVPGIPSQARDFIIDKDFVEVYCLMTKWKSGEFFAALDSVKENLYPAIEKVREMVIDINTPNLEEIKSEAEAKLNAICNAATVEAANAAVQDFYDFGTNFDESMKSLNTELDTKLRAKGEALKEKVNAEINHFVEEQKTKMNEEIKSFADGLAADFQNQLNTEIEAQQFTSAEQAQSFVESRVASFESSIKIEISAKVEEKKKELQAAIQVKVEEVVGPEKKKFEDIGNLFKNMGNKIQAGIASRQGQYEQYKDQAFAKRKEIVFKLVDKNIEQGLTELEKNQSQLEEARKGDPTVKSVDEIKSELAQDRKVLEAKLDVALAAGNESAFGGALDDFRAKWENFRTEMEKEASQATSKICTVAMAQFQAANSQIDPGLQKIKDLQARCSANTSDECLKVNELAPRFNTLTSKLSNIKSAIADAQKMCQSPETADRQNLIILMNKIKSDGEDVKIYGEALAAEKSKIIAASVKQICDQVLPQLAAAKTEIAKNDLAVLQGNIDKCKGKTTAECQVINQLTVKFNDLNSKINSFSNDISKFEWICGNPGESNFEQLRDTGNILKGRGDEIKLLAKELQALQAEKGSEKALCQAIVPELDIAKAQVSSGLKEIASTQSACSGKIDAKCARINSLGDKFNSAKNQSENIFKKISDVDRICEMAGTGVPSESLLTLIESLKTDEESVRAVIADLKTEKEKSYVMGTEIVIPKNSVWEGILPATKTLELFGRIDYQKAGGGQWLMEISVNDYPITSALINKGMSFRYADGRVFPYFSSGGGSGQTSFKDGRPFIYYKTQGSAWMLFYVPNFDTDNTSVGDGYQVLTDPGQAHRYVWNISSLVGNADTMTVKIRNNGFVGAGTLPLVVKLYAK